MPKRNNFGHRYPGGKLKPLIQFETASPREVRQIIDTAKAQARNPLLRTELGRLRLNDVVGDRQTDAGMRFATLAGFYARVKGFPRATVASPSYEAGYGGKSGDNDAEDDQIVEALTRKPPIPIEELALNSDRLARILATVKRYDAALASLSGAGLEARVSVLEVVILDRHIVSGKHHALKAGLTALADHFAIVTRR